jgi:hypothetical protein
MATNLNQDALSDELLGQDANQVALERQRILSKQPVVTEGPAWMQGQKAPMSGFPAMPPMQPDAGDTTPVAPPAPTTKGTVGAYKLEGYDPQKLASGHNSPKYQIGRTISQFDPRQGITPEVIAALNALGLGTFEGSGQNLRVGADASPEFEGYTGWGDMIRGYQGGAGENAAWQYGINNSMDPPAGGGGIGSGLGGMNAQQAMGGGVGLNALLSGDAFTRIQEALSKINGQGQVNLDALLANFQGS